MAGCSPACGRDGGGERRVRLRNSGSGRSARAWRSLCRTCIRTSRSMRRRIPAADPCRSTRIQALDPASIAPSLLIRDRLCATFRGWAILWRARLMAAFYWPRSSPWRERTITNCQIAAFVASGCRNRRRTGVTHRASTRHRGTNVREQAHSEARSFRPESERCRGLRPRCVDKSAWRSVSRKEYARRSRVYVGWLSALKHCRLAEFRLPHRQWGRSAIEGGPA